MDRLSQSPPSTKKRRGRSRKNAAAAVVTTDLFLATAGTHVAPAHYADRPLLATLVAEDTCWQFTVAEWRSRRPSWYQKADRKQWRAEGKLLDAKRDRIREQAAEMGLRLSQAEGR